MKTPRNIKIPEYSVYARVPLDYELFDRRIRTYGLSFGKVGTVAKNFGVKCSDIGGCMKFTAPKGRLQYFAEKLHFSMIPYSQTPPKNPPK